MSIKCDGRASKPGSSDSLADKVDFISFFGIADIYGIDRYMKCIDIESEANLQDRSFAQIRAQLNRHRHSVYFECIDAPALYVDIIDKLLEEDKYEDALSIVKSCPLRIPEGYKNSWDLIPNPKLDPYYNEDSELISDVSTDVSDNN